MENSSNPETAFAPLRVACEESGQKLLQYLQRRFNLPQSLLHRLIRTGQIRVNGHRKKAFDRVNEGELIRLPPFVWELSTANPEKRGISAEANKQPLEILEEWKNLLFIKKPRNIPVHGGTGHEESVNSILSTIYADRVFKPVCAHRLDKETTGLLVAATTWETLQNLQKDFAQSEVHKEYLAWVHGNWEHPDKLYIQHFFKRETMDGKEKTVIYDYPIKDGKPAEAIVNCVKQTGKRSLLHIRLLTGRKHQIRAHLAHLQHPVLGDCKYGTDRNQPLLLHSFRIILPDGHEVRLLPDWKDDYTVLSAPSPL